MAFYRKMLDVLPRPEAPYGAAGATVYAGESHLLKRNAPGDDSEGLFQGCHAAKYASRVSGVNDSRGLDCTPAHLDSAASRKDIATSSHRIVRGTIRFFFFLHDRVEKYHSFHRVGNR